jgi:hypothetical protein
MTDCNDLPDEMRRLGLDEVTLDRLLAGRIGPDDAPPGYSEVARILQVAVAAGDDEELVHEAAHVALAMELVKQPSPASTPSDWRLRKTRSRSRRVKVGGLVLVGALVGSTGLAAAGTLPDAAQDAFSAVLERVGISVPASGDHPASGDPPASGDHPASSGEEIAEIATVTDATSMEKGAEISSAASGGMSQAGQHGSAVVGTGAEGADAAPVPVPNEGGTGTADTASDGAGDEGTSIADEKSEGRSGSGSANASVAPSGPVVVPGPPVEPGA